MPRMRAAKVALVPGLAGTAFGGYQVYDVIYDWYRESDFVPVIALFGAGVLLLAFSLARLISPLLATIVVPAGIGAVLVALKLGKVHDNERMSDLRSRAATGSAASPRDPGRAEAAAGSPR